MGTRKPASKPAAKPKAAPKPKINILAAMREEIVQSQIAIAKKVGIPVNDKTPAVPKPKDQKTQKLVEFLLTKPFGCNNEKVIDFAEILHGDIRKYIPVTTKSSTEDDDRKKPYFTAGTIYHNGSSVLIIVERDHDDVQDLTVNDTDIDSILGSDQNDVDDLLNRDLTILPMLTETLIRSTVAKYTDNTITQIYTAMNTIKKESK